MDLRPEKPRDMSLLPGPEQLLTDAMWSAVILGGPLPEGAAVPRGSCLPVLITVRQWNSNLTWREKLHYSRAVTGHIRGMLLRNNPGSGLISLGEQRNLAVIPGGVPIRTAGLCNALIQICQAELLCEVACYIGKPAPPEALSAMTDRLVELDGENVAEVSLRFLDSAGPEGGDLQSCLAQGSVLLRSERYDEFLEYIYRVLDREKEALSLEKLNHFNQDMLQLLYSVMYERSVAAHTLFQKTDQIRLFRDAPLSVNNTLTWIFTAVTTLSEALREQYQRQDYTQQTKTYIRTHLRESFTRQDIAAYVHVSQNHLARLFRRETGMSIAEFTLRERIRLAVHLLVETDLSVGEIAQRAGYENYSYFLTLFRRTTGMTPSAYRQSHSQREKGDESEP